MCISQRVSGPTHNGEQDVLFGQEITVFEAVITKPENFVGYDEFESRIISFDNYSDIFCLCQFEFSIYIFVS